jgi:hypothetical protein
VRASTRFPCWLSWQQHFCTGRVEGTYFAAIAATTLAAGTDSLWSCCRTSTKVVTLLLSSAAGLKPNRLTGHGSDLRQMSQGHLSRCRVQASIAPTSSTTPSSLITAVSRR